MKRLLSIILVVSMLFGMVQVPVTANNGPGNSSERSDDADFGDEGPSDMSETGTDEDNGPADMSTEESFNCTHERTRKAYHETKYEKYNSEKHSYKETYEIVCKDCGKVLSAEKTESGKEVHRFRRGKCADCDYVIKNCNHEETVEKVTYWRTEEDERGNDKSFTLVDVVCKLCDEKIT